MDHNPNDHSDEKAVLSRRRFLDNAGKLAAYTPPLMLGLLIPGEHAIASGASGKWHPDLGDWRPGGRPGGRPGDGNWPPGDDGGD